jgi:hypothetical protein
MHGLPSSSTAKSLPSNKLVCRATVGQLHEALLRRLGRKNPPNFRRTVRGIE